MMLFWIMGVILVALALAFVLPAMLRPPARTETTADTQSLNNALYKERLVELEKDLADGLIEQDRYETAREDLERELLHELGHYDDDAAQATAQSDVTGGRWMIAVVALLIPLITLSLYLNIGELRLAGIEHAAANRPASRPAADSSVAQQANQQHSVAEMVQQLKARLQEQPDDPEGWTMLGRSYMVTEQFAEAANAFQQARALVGDVDPDLLAAYAEALGLTNGGQLAGEPARLIETALSIDANNGRALWLMGHYRLQIGDNGGAAQHWRKLLATLPAGSQQSQLINQYLAQIGEAGSASATSTAQAPEPATGGAERAINVRVTLDPALDGRARAEDTVFVFARAAQGPRMPLAILRGQVKDLPMTVTLDDSLAMTPTMTLSSAADVIVGARISRSGNATPQPGDLQGASEAIQPASEVSVELTINEIVE